MRNKKTWWCILAFFALNFLIQALIRTYAPSAPPARALDWSSAAVVQADGTLVSFDPDSGLPPLEEGEWYRFSAVLPQERQEDVFLTLQPAGLETVVSLDGQELWRCAQYTSPDQTNEVRLPLPAGGGETLTVDLRPTGAALPDSFPPPLALSLSPDQTASVSFRRLPIEAPPRLLLLFWGLFLISLGRGMTDWLLLLPMLAILLRILWQIATGTGAGLLPPLAQSLFSSPWMNVLTILVMVLYLALHRHRGFWKLLGKIALWFSGILLLCALFSTVRGGPVYRYFLSPGIDSLQKGDFSALPYWFTLWLILLSMLMAIWELIHSVAHLQIEARALSLRNNLLMANYQALERKVRESAALRHESSHRLAALDAMLQAGDWKGLQESLAAWRQANSAASQTLFTKNITVNAILQDAASRARGSGIAFQAAAAVPEELPFPDEDLCALLMNLLDNALEGAERTPAGTQKAIRFKMLLSGGRLSILCENTFDGHVSVDANGALRTIKEDPDSHGFGLAQIRAVAKKYAAAPDLRYTDSLFTVQLVLPVSRAGKTAMK